MILKRNFLAIALFMFSSSVFYGQSHKQALTTSNFGIIDGNTKLTITYGPLAVAGRAILDEFVPYSKVWVPGSGHVTIFETSKALMIQDDYFLPAGIYSLYIIPEGSEPCTIIFNKNIDDTSNSTYDKSKDQLRIKVNTVFTEDNIENLIFKINPLKVVMNWANWELSFKATQAIELDTDH